LPVEETPLELFFLRFRSTRAYGALFATESWAGDCKVEHTPITVREIEPSDREWVQSFLGPQFGSTEVVPVGA
jgi:hypothetical protein